MAVGDRVLMLEHSVYSVIPPEGCAAILWRDKEKAPEAAQALNLTAESANEILADKVVALTAREVLKYRDVWDVWYLVKKLNAQADRDVVTRKFADYGTSDIEAKAKQRQEDLAKDSTAKSFLDEMRRFLPAKRVGEMSDAGLHRTILAASGELIERAVLPIAPK